MFNHPFFLLMMRISLLAAVHFQSFLYNFRNIFPAISRHAVSRSTGYKKDPLMFVADCLKAEAIYLTGLPSPQVPW